MTTDETQKQPYDNLLKRLLEGQSTEILPLLLAKTQPGLQVEEELNIEVLLPPRRTDRIYRASVCGESMIIHIEFEVSANTEMDKRLLIYHAILHEKHKLPVYSVIIYPFKVSMVDPPLCESHRSRNLLTFHYQTIPLWQLDARPYVEQRAIPIYGLLPTMDGLDDTLLLQALDQMVEYYGTNEARLREELLCFQVLLQRANRLKEHEMRIVLERIHMFDPLLEEDPWIQSLQAKTRDAALIEGREEGRMEGELLANRATCAQIVQLRFPNLAAFAETRTACIESAKVLNHLAGQLILCADERAARSILQTSYLS